MNLQNTMIREIEKKDYTSVAVIWRNVLGFSVMDENVAASRHW